MESVNQVKTPLLLGSEYPPGVGGERCSRRLSRRTCLEESRPEGCWHLCSSQKSSRKLWGQGPSPWAPSVDCESALPAGSVISSLGVQARIVVRLCPLRSNLKSLLDLQGASLGRFLQSPVPWFIPLCFDFNGLPRWRSAKESACQCRRCRFDPWVREIPWRRKWQPPPLFLLGKFNALRSLGCSLQGLQSWTQLSN